MLQTQLLLTFPLQGITYVELTIRRTYGIMLLPINGSGVLIVHNADYSPQLLLNPGRVHLLDW